MIIIMSITGLLLVLVIIFIERSYKIYNLKKLLNVQSAQILDYKNKKEDFAMWMSKTKNSNASDSLTHLINKQAFDKQFNNLIAQSKRFNNLFALLMLDIKKFKDINSRYSQAIGDKLLIEVGRRLKETIRDVDIVSRYENDVFAVLLPNMIKPEIIVHAVERIIQDTSLPFEVGQSTIEINVCVGVGIYPFDGEDKETLFRNTKVALMRAKADGKNVFEFYQEETQVRGEQELSLKAAVRRQDFLENISLEYKPYYNTQNQEIDCIEVVASLNHPELGKIPFNEVVRIAHYSSRMFELYEWLIKSSIQKFDFTENTNLKPRRFLFTFNLSQFGTPKFSENIITIIKKLSSSGNEIIMEITDDDINNANLEMFREAIIKLNESNIYIAIGILVLGHFSLNKINNVLFSYLKIDEKLVKDINKRKESQAILERIMSLANSLKIDTLTTGVDTEEQKQVLVSMGCVTMQGKALEKKNSEGFFI